MLNSSLRVLTCTCICAILLLSACGDSTNVGSDIFSNEDLQVLFADDIELITKTVRLDSIKTYNNTDEADECLLSSLPIRRWSTFILPTHYLGMVDDPVFGKSKSSIYTEVGFVETNTTDIYLLPTFTGTLDSMVLSLDYDTTALYGDINETFDVEVYRVMESFDLLGDAAFNTSSLQQSPVLLGKLQDISYSLDSLNVILPGTDSVTISVQAPGIRIPIDSMIGGMPSLPLEIFNSADANTSVELFEQLLSGLYITTSSEGNVMPGMLIANSQLELFYTNADGESQLYPFRLFRNDLISFNHIESDRDGSEAGLAAQASSSDQMLYVSGQDGFDVTIDFSDINKYENSVLNKVQLEFTLVEPAVQENQFFPASDKLLLSELGDNNELKCITDVGLSLINQNGGPLFGGVLEEVEENGSVLRKYSMNITTHVQNYLEGNTSSVLVLSVDNRTDNASRVALFGPNHPTHPAKMKLTYTAP